MAARVGGATKSREPDAAAQEAFDAVKAAVATKLGKEGPDAKVVAVKTQVVAGVNYFLKVGPYADDTYALVRVYRNLQGQHELSGVQGDKKADDELTTIPPDN